MLEAVDPMADPLPVAVLPVALPVALPVLPVALPVLPVALPVEPAPGGVLAPEAPDDDPLEETLVRMNPPAEPVADDDAPEVLVAPDVDVRPDCRHPVSVTVWPLRPLALLEAPVWPVPLGVCADTATAKAAAHTVPIRN